MRLLSIISVILFERINKTNEGTEWTTGIYPLPHEEKISISLVYCSLWAFQKQCVCNIDISRIEALVKEKLFILEGLVTILHDMRTLSAVIGV
jgi:hypothetical protein